MYFDAQSSDPFHTNVLFVMFKTMHCKKDRGYETTKYLCHKSGFAPCNKAINF